MRISAIMSVYKEPLDLLKNTVDSVLKQTYSDWELIITIDNPENREAIAYADELSRKENRITYIVNKKNLGLGMCKNNAIQVAKGEFIASQDADDLSLPDRFQKQIAYLDAHPEVGMVGTAIIYRDLNTQKDIFIKTYPSIVGKEIHKRTTCGHPSVMVRKEIFFKNGFYDSQTIFTKGAQAFCEDYDLWLRWYIANVKMANLSEPLIIYMRDVSKITKAKAALKSVVDIKKKYLNSLPYSFSDYLYLYGQQVFSYMPSSVISWAFYLSNRIKARLTPPFVKN